jgi:polysaccharide deacetylase family protein (PEP-CTERM system associated)
MTAERGLARGATPRTVLNAFTIDLEEWFHICGVDALGPANWDTLPSRVVPTTSWLLDLLDRRQIRATFFVVGWIADRHPDIVARVIAAGHEVGSHGYGHQRVYELGPQKFVDDLSASRRALAAVGADGVDLFRAPEWSINERSLWALDLLVEQRFRLDASMAPLKMVGSVEFPRDPHLRETRHGSIAEIPPLVTDRFGAVMPLGWGWGLRMTSPRRVLRTLDTLNGSGRSAVLTIHPWELDLDPPRVRLPAGLRFAHYFRLDGFRERLSAILAGTNFGPITALAATHASST